MNRKSKTISGLSSGISIVKRSSRHFTITERDHAVQEYSSSGSAKQEIRKKYTEKDDHGVLLRWMQKLGYKNFVNAEKRKDIY
jgi:hypothetical protein